MKPTIQPVSFKQVEAQLDTLFSRVENPNHGVFGPDSMMWKLSRHASNFLSAWRTSLYELAHPWVANAIDQKSTTKSDPIRRFHRTFRIVWSLVYGNEEQVRHAARAIFLLHQRIEGRISEDTGAFAKESMYMANEAHAMLWVHATLWEATVVFYELFVEELYESEKEAFYQETKRFALLFGIPESIIPDSWSSFNRYFNEMVDSDKLIVKDAGLRMGRMLFEFKKPIIQQISPRAEIMTSYLIAPKLREAFELPEMTQAMINRSERIIKQFKILFSCSPNKFRLTPAFHEATERISGCKEASFVIKKANQFWLGCPQLVSKSMVMNEKFEIVASK